MSLIPSMKRESVTTKLMSTYAKLAEDDDWEYIEKETKRTSSNFATLIDEIFEYEKYEQIRKEKEELERKVREAKAREELERRRRKQEEKERARKLLEKEDLKRKQEELKKQIEIDISDLEQELSKHKEENLMVILDLSLLLWKMKRKISIIWRLILTIFSVAATFLYKLDLCQGLIRV